MGDVFFGLPRSKHSHTGVFMVGKPTATGKGSNPDFNKIVIESMSLSRSSVVYHGISFVQHNISYFYCHSWSVCQEPHSLTSITGPRISFDDFPKVIEMKYT